MDPTDLDLATLRRLEAGHERRRHGLLASEWATHGALALGFLVGAVGLALVGEAERAFEPLLALAFVAAYALVASAEFQTGAGYLVATEIVLVPMLLLLPTPLVPLLVGLAYVVQTVAIALRGHVAPARLLISVADAWHVLPPAAVLVAAGAQVPAWGDWPIFLAALLVQIAADLVVSMARTRAAVGVSAREVFGELALGARIDAVLFPVGLLAAFGARDEPAAALLLLPLVALFALYSREREARFTQAIELSQAYRGTALVLRDVIEEDDEYTARHTEGVVELAVEVADALAVDDETRRAAELGALLHDVGKIAVPNEIINKPGPLDEAEWKVIRTHTIEGQRMLEQVGGLLANVGMVVRASHERWDGGGYPDGLKRDRIPLAARIVSACDAFNAMVTDRPYRQGMPLPRALGELQANAGTQFDPAVVSALVRVTHAQAPALVEPVQR
jgi:putative nucleotidyltransferase with HDIG domain